ncbi:mechanosensitive ion channel family protein [Lachnospiraceae bacterium LCP25S3_G4]
MLLTSDIAVKTAQETVEEVSRFTAYLDNHVSDLISFGIKVLLAILFFLIGGRIIKWVRNIVRRSLERSKADVGVEQFVDSFLKFSLYAILIVSIAMKFGVEPASVAALLGSAGVAIGLALQGSLSNLAGGVLILLLKPFVVGDYIIEDNHKNEGTVKEIQIFYTKLSTIDNKTIVIPNGSLANNSLTNVTAKNERRLDLYIDVSYEADIKKAKEVIIKILHQEEKILKEEEIIVFVDSLSQSSVVIGTRAWVRTEDYWTTKWRLLELIKLTFDKEKIVIPYNQLTVHVEDGKE